MVQKFVFINESSQGTQSEANSIFRQHAVPYETSTTYQVFTDRIVYQHRPGYNQYSWYKFNVQAASSGRGGSARIGITWSSRHASPGAYGEYSFAWTDEHHTSYASVFCRKQHFLSIGGASHGPYNWTSQPAVTVYSSTGGGSQAGFYLRVEGHLDANSSTYDGGVMHHFDIVCNDNNILTKPRDKIEAFQMLNSLSGRTHKVITSVCLYSINKKVVFSEETSVRFLDLDDEIIANYIEKYHPFDKAGSYGIQEWIGLIGVDEIKGSFTNVVGLPSSKLFQKIRNF